MESSMSLKKMGATVGNFEKKESSLVDTKKEI